MSDKNSNTDRYDLPPDIKAQIYRDVKRFGFSFAEMRESFELARLAMDLLKYRRIGANDNSSES